MPESILEWGISLILALQGLGDWLIGPMNVLTFTGNTEFYLLVLPALYWCWDSRLGLRVGIGLLVSAGLNGILKVALHDPRPYWFDPQVRLLTGAETSLGIPSGHSQNSMVIWGTLGAYLQKGWGWAIVVAMIFLIGLSRMYLGVHFPTDVFAGWTLGIVLLVLFLRLENTATAWMKRLSEVQQIAVAFVISLIIIPGAQVYSSVSTAWQLPDEWAQNAAVRAPNEPIAPFSIDDLILCASAFFGLLAGTISFNRRREFDARGHWAKRLGRYLIGAVGVFVLWQGLGALFSLVAADESLLGYVLRYIRYGLIGAWISALGPMVFIWLKLAEGKAVASSQ